MERDSVESARVDDLPDREDSTPPIDLHNSAATILTDSWNNFCTCSRVTRPFSRNLN